MGWSWLIFNQIAIPIHEVEKTEFKINLTTGKTIHEFLYI
jgi:hypothetical protein